MSRFGGTLQELSRRLSLPHQVRSRVLLEVSGDLNDLFETFLNRGYPEAEAEREALSHVDLSDETLRELARVHGGWFRRFTDMIAERAGHRWERALAVLLVAAGLVLSGALVQAVPMSRAAGPWLLPVLVAALVSAALGLWKAYGLWLRGDHRPQTLHAGLGVMLFMAVLELFLAFGAVGLSALQVVRAMGSAPERSGLMTMEWLLASLALLVMSLSLAMVGALAWFFLAGRVATIERREAAALLHH